MAVSSIMTPSVNPVSASSSQIRSLCRLQFGARSTNFYFFPMADQKNFDLAKDCIDNPKDFLGTVWEYEPGLDNARIRKSGGNFVARNLQKVKVIEFNGDIQQRGYVFFNPDGSSQILKCNK